MFDQSPYELMFSPKPNYSRLHVLGCLFYALVLPWSKDKNFWMCQSVSLLDIFMDKGDTRSKTYINTIFISWDFVFYNKFSLITTTISHHIHRPLNLNLYLYLFLTMISWLLNCLQLLLLIAWTHLLPAFITIYYSAWHTNLAFKSSNHFQNYATSNTINSTSFKLYNIAILLPWLSWWTPQASHFTSSNHASLMRLIHYDIFFYILNPLLQMLLFSDHSTRWAKIHWDIFF